MAETSLDPAYEVAMALADFDSPDARKRAAARERIKNLRSEAFEPLVVLRKEATARQRAAAYNAPFTYSSEQLWPSLLVISGVISFVTLAIAGNGGSWLPCLVSIAVFVFSLYMFDHDRKEPDRSNHKAPVVDACRKDRVDRAIAGLEDPSCLGKLAEQLPLDEMGRAELETHDPFAQALAVIVPKSGRRDVESLTDYQRSRLFGTLDMFNSITNPDVVEAVIWLAVRCELSEYVPRIWAIANSGVSRERSELVRKTAREAMSFFQGLEANASAARTLLRASDSPPDTKETLLRPAGYGTESDATLLRPAENV